MSSLENLNRIRSLLEIETEHPFTAITGKEYEPLRAIPHKEDVTALAVLEASSELCYLLKKHHQETLQYLQKLTEEPNGHAAETKNQEQPASSKSRKPSEHHEEDLQRFSYLARALQQSLQVLSSYWQKLWRS